MRRLWPIIAGVFVLTSAACTQRAPAPHGSGASVVTPTPAASVMPAQTVAPTATPESEYAPTPEGMVATTPEPMATPTAPPIEIFSPVLVAPNAAPRIIAVNLSNQIVHGGDTISGIVETTSNVASVEARIATFSISVPKVGVGRFALNYVVPNVPFFFHGTYPMTVIARNAAGAKAERVIPITVD
jgi:hypothetical protein